MDEEDYLCRECHYGSYFRSIMLSHAIKTDNAKDYFEDGVLTLTIPRAKEAKPKTVEVKAKKAVGPGKKGTKRVTKKTAAKKRDGKGEA